MTVTLDKAQTNGIGTLREKTVHATLKKLIEQDPMRREVPCGAYIADVLSDGKIYEIQTRGFDRLIPKLNCFLQEYDVTVVYPVEMTKRIVWISPETGECRKPRISNKHGTIWDIFPELYRIRSFIGHPRLSFCAVLMDVTEFRLMDGLGDGKKKHATRVDRIPTEFLQKIVIGTKEDMRRLLPEELPATFTIDIFREITGASERSAGAALRILREYRFIDCVGKSKRKNLYSVLI